MLKKTLSDQEVLQAIKDGNDKVALEHLYTTLLPIVQKLTKRFKPKDIDSYDIFQEAIMKFYDYVKKDKFNQNHSIGAFIVSVSKHKLIDMTRKKSYKIEVSPDELYDHFEDSKPFDLIEIEEKKSVLNEIFDLVGERCKELLLLSVFDRRPMTEISTLLNFSTVDSAKTQNYKCKQKLIKGLENHPELARQIFPNA